MDWIGLDDIITYPYAWTVNFNICLDAQLGTHQPQIPKTTQASAWSYKYNGRWMGKTGSSPTGIRKNFGRLNGWKIPRQKWSISYLWEHFLVPEHRIPIWLGFILGLHQWNTDGTHQNHWSSLGVIDILKYWMNQNSQNHWNSLGFIVILKSWHHLKFKNDANSLGF